ncbi:hypothetical protein MTO96_006139 [Rhipicephalus appendiculatus]
MLNLRRQHDSVLERLDKEIQQRRTYPAGWTLWLQPAKKRTAVASPEVKCDLKGTKGQNLGVALPINISRRSSTCTDEGRVL